MVTLAVKYGFGRHVWNIGSSDVPKVIMHDYIAQAFGLCGSALGRIAFIVYVIGLLGIEKRYKVILWFLLSLQLVTNGIFIIIIFAQCPAHGSAIWNRPVRSKCWDPHVQAYYGYFQGCK